MQLREIKQHHLPAIFSISSLLLIDSIAYYFAYEITNKITINQVGLVFPWRVYFGFILILYLFKRFNPSPRISRGEEAKIIIQAIYLIGIIYIVGKILSKGITIDQSQYNLLFLHIFLILDIPLRFTVRSIQRLFLSKGIGGRSTILLGTGKDAQNLANEILHRPTLGFTLKGYFSQSESKEMNHCCSYLGSPDDIYTYVQTHNIHEMIIVLNNHKHDKLLDIIGRYEMLDICIKIIPDMYESISGRVRIDVLNDIPLMDINPDIMTEFQSIVKRTGDILLSLASLIILLPLFFVLMIIIGLSSPGGIFYKQIRMGKDGIQFSVYKFRSMYQDSESKTGPIWSDKGDKRITPIGKLIRKFHFDEIPQFINVLMGKMSIVGPRPERPQIIEVLIKEIPYYRHRMKVKPGITGWAQIRGVYDASLGDVYIKLKHDFYYIENMSLSLDCKILLLTVWAVIKGKGR